MESGTFSIYDKVPGYQVNYQYIEINDSVFEKINASDMTKEKAYDLVPKYNESNWIKSTDNKFSIDRSTYTGDKSFVVWAKLISANGTVNYDFAVYSVSGSKQEEKNTTKEDSTTATTKIPQTGQSFTIVAVIAILSVIGAAGYKFIRKNRDIK